MWDHHPEARPQLSRALKRLSRGINETVMQRRS